jgi:hypothetical protein
MLLDHFSSGVSATSKMACIPAMALIPFLGAGFSFRLSWLLQAFLKGSANTRFLSTCKVTSLCDAFCFV